MATLTGTGNDSLVGTNDPGDSISGIGGNDTIRSLDGADSINQSGTGNNLIYGNLGNDQIASEASGNDTIYGGRGADLIDKSDGAGSNKLYGNADNDTIYGGAGNDTVYGGRGDDFIVDSKGGSNLLHGNLGNDTIVVGDLLQKKPANSSQAQIGAVSDTVYGGQGADVVAVFNGDDTRLYGDLGDDSLLGGTGSDSIFGGQGDDVIGGGGGEDTISGNLGADTMTGGSVDFDPATFKIKGVFSDGERDVFQIVVGDTGNTAVTADHILTFETTIDQLDLSIAGSADNYIAASSSLVTDFNSAKAYANTLLTGKTYAYVTGQNGSADDGYLFIDNTGDGRSDAAIVFDGGTSLATVKSSDIV